MIACHHVLQLHTCPYTVVDLLACCPNTNCGKLSPCPNKGRGILLATGIDGIARGRCDRPSYYGEDDTANITAVAAHYLARMGNTVISSSCRLYVRCEIDGHMVNA
jgi:hypothetical protein